MAREFDGPLSKSDIEWLKARYPESYVARMVDLHGLKKGKKSQEPDTSGDAGDGSSKGEGTEGEGQVPEGTEGAGDGSEGTGDEDLIGNPNGDPSGDEEFDVVGSTEAEVKTWAESASDEDKASALAAEQARTDREPRKGVVSLLA